MAKSKGVKKKKKDASPRTAIGERRQQTRPLWAVSLFTISILISVALLDYEPNQSPYVTTKAIAEGSGNTVGVIGAYIGFWTFHILGIAAWWIPVYLFRLSFQCIYRQAEFLRWQRSWAIKLRE